VGVDLRNFETADRAISRAFCQSTVLVFSFAAFSL